MLSGATHGFLFTTGGLTRQAMKHAIALKWLRVLSGAQLVHYIEKVHADANSLSDVERENSNC
jgi:hypothetical protein